MNLKTGETKFANNLTDHNANVEQLRKWVAENPHPTSTGENNK
ncbi:hypothetical protein [Trueperella pyogenes]